MDDMSQTTLIMNTDNTFTHPDDGMLTLQEWADLNGVSDRSVKRWLAADELPGAYKEADGKERWMIPATAVRTKKATTDNQEIAVVEPTSTDVAATEPDDEIDEEFEAHLWQRDLEFYLSKMPAYVPVRIGALMLGLGVTYVKSNPDQFGILHRGGPNQTDVMPKAIILERAGLRG